MFFTSKGGDEASVKNVSLSIKEGECVLLCGESGCGKTTLIRMLNGLIPHFYEGNIQGQVTVDEMNITESELYETARVVGIVGPNGAGKSTFSKCLCGLDFFNMEKVAELIKSLRGEKTVCVVTHDPDLVRRCCTKVIQLIDGHVVNDERKGINHGREEEKCFTSVI